MTLYGYDISGWQSTLDPSVVPSDFVIVKATGGKSYLNPYCDRHVQAAKAAGKKVGVYHFVHDPGSEGTAAEEAQWFLDNIQGYLDGSVLLIMDWEADNVTDSGYALEFKRLVESGANQRVMVYGSVSQLQYLKPCCDDGSPLWVAGYSLGYQRISGYNPPDGPLGMPDWATASMWQYTSQGYLPGYSGALDLDVFYGDGAAWDSLCAKLDGVIKYQGSTKENDVSAEQVMSWPVERPDGQTLRTVDVLATVSQDVGTTLDLVRLILSQTSESMANDRKQVEALEAIKEALAQRDVATIIQQIAAAGLVEAVAAGLAERLKQ